MSAPKTCLSVTAKISLALASVLLLAGAAPSAERGPNTVRFGSVWGRPHFVIDETNAVAGVPTRFFTGRPNDYLGWYLEFEQRSPRGKQWGLGWVAGAKAWQTGYWLNWDVPDLGVSLEPMRSKWQVGYLSAGPLAYVQAGPARLMASVSLTFGMSTFELKTEDASESGAAIYGGFQPGIEGNLQLSRVVGLTAGYNATLLLIRHPEYDVEEGVTLHGQHTSWPTEFHASLSFSKR